MEKDKNLQSILTKYALQQTSEGFEEKIMQRITELKTRPATSLIDRMLLRTLLIIFFVVMLVLLIAAFFVQPKSLFIPVSISVSPGIYTQLFSFLAAFWIVMLINLWWNKRNALGSQP
jgi:hypothetical protein